MKIPRRRFLHLAAGAAALPAVSRMARADTYPSRPVHLIVGFPPGGPTDIFARLIGQWLSERLGQSFVVDNRAGAGGNIGTEAVVNAPPDGYTLLLVLGSNAYNAALYDNLNFNFIRDIAPGETGRSARPPDPFEDGGGVGDDDTPFSKKYPFGCRCAVAAMRYRDLTSHRVLARRYPKGLHALHFTQYLSGRGIHIMNLLTGQTAHGRISIPVSGRVRSGPPLGKELCARTGENKRCHLPLWRVARPSF
jgi:Tripartite tricarboxylate transporter family receptor